MAGYGCYFRSAQAVAEIFTGTALSAEQIRAAVTLMQNTRSPYPPGTENMVLGVRKVLCMLITLMSL